MRDYRSHPDILLWTLARALELPLELFELVIGIAVSPIPEGLLSASVVQRATSVTAPSVTRVTAGILQIDNDGQKILFSLEPTIRGSR